MSIELVSVNGETTSQPLRRHQMSLRLKSRSSGEKSINVEAIGAFKHSPSFEPQHFKTTRPIMERYCSCMSGKKRDLITSNMKELGMRNLLNVKSNSVHNGLLAQCFPAEIYTLKKPLFRNYQDISVSVLSSPRVRLAIQETARQIIEGSDTHGLSESQVMLSVNKESEIIMKKMKASISAVFLKFAGWFLTKFLSLFINSIQVSKAQMMILQQASQKGVPMIYLPLHRSHLDYILTTLTLWHYNIRAPFVAAGDNLDMPFFNLLMKGLGGFFIRRRLDPKAGCKDILYRAILHEYMTELLKKGEGLEFFIEGGRSRTGRAIIPKGGLLSVLVETCNSGDIPDAYIIPASFSYEKIIDGNFSREQMGLPKINESFCGTMRAIFRIIFGSYGSVRLDFAPPFSLKEFVDYTNNNPYPAPLTPPSRSMSLPEDSYPNISHALWVDCKSGMNTRMLVKALADHTVYTSDHYTSPMSTHITAFLLLTKYRQGVCVKELSKSVLWIVRELQAFHVDVGFCGKPEDIILYAQHMLGRDLISKVWKTEHDDFVICPNLSLPNVFELSYYSNVVSNHFILESVLACAVMYESNLSMVHLISSTPQNESKFTREKLLETAQEICFLIRSEYIFVSPCEELSSVLSELLDSFVSKEFLSLEENENDYAFHGANALRVSNLAKSLDIDEDETHGAYIADQVLKVNVHKAHVPERLHFLVSVGGPILESQYVTCKFILNYLHDEKLESEFYKALGHFAQSRVYDGTAIFSESCAMLNLKSSVKSLEELKLIYSHRSAGLTMMGVTQQAESTESLESYVHLLERVLY